MTLRDWLALPFLALFAYTFCAALWFRKQQDIARHERDFDSQFPSLRTP
jgi:hypothetical protein